jgi:hypothetical protein
LILQQGRPKDCAERTARELAVYDLLDRLEIPYARADHAPAETMEVCAAIDEVLNCRICKNLFLCNRQQTAFYLLMMPGDKSFKTKELSAQIDSARLSFAPAEKMVEYLGLFPGSVSVMGLMNDNEHKVQLLVDQDLFRDAYIGCHPCVNTSSLKLRRADIFETFLSAVKHNYLSVELNGE